MKKTFKSLILAGIFAGLSFNCAYAEDGMEELPVVEPTCTEACAAASELCDQTEEECQAANNVCLTGCELNSCVAGCTTDLGTCNGNCVDYAVACNDLCTEGDTDCATDCDAEKATCEGDCAAENNDCLTDTCGVSPEEICTDECTTGLEECNETCDIDTVIANCKTACDAVGEEDDYADCTAGCDEITCDAICTTANAECVADCVEPETLLTCTPETLNLKSNGRWITCFVQSENIVAVEDVDVDAIMLNDTFSAEKACMEDDGLLMLKFSRADLIASLLPGEEKVEFPMETELIVTGAMSDGSPLEATDTIRVIYPQPKEEQVKAQKKEKTNKANKKGKK